MLNSTFAKCSIQGAIHKKEVVVTDTVETNTSGPPEHSLKSGVLGLFDSAIMGIAGSAPAYSISATTLFLFGAVGLGGPASLLYCGFFMFGIVFAFNYLSKSDTNAGATYSWVRRALHPFLGYLAGWALIVSALIFMVIATFPAGSNILDIFRPSLASNKTLITILGAVFFLLMVYAVAAGVTVTVTVQIIMSCTEIALLLLFAGLAIFHSHVTPFSWHWFSPSIFTRVHSNTFFAGALLAAFYYWGWDVTANLNEETKVGEVNQEKATQTSTSGMGGILGTIVVFLLFEVFTIGANMVIPAKDMGTNSQYSADILAHLGQLVAPGWFGKLIVVGVLLSTIATLETTLIQVTRTLFSMGRDKTLPSALGHVHAQRRTPLVATVTVTIISLALFVGSQYIGSVYNILQDGYSAIGIQICIYYSLAGFSVVVLYRRQLFKSAKNFIFMGLWPLLGAVFMMVVFIKVIPSLNTTTKIVGLGSMALGLIPMTYYWLKKAPYFEMPTKEDRHAILQEIQQNL
jgi:amino acid transporter